MSKKRRRLQEWEEVYDPFNEQAPTKKSQAGSLDKFKPTRKQEWCLDEITDNTLTFIEAPAGTGKSSTALFYACQRYTEVGGGNYKIFVVRAADPVGHGLGFLKGELEEKIEPVFAPARDILNKFLGKNKVDNDIKNGNIQFKTPDYMLGTTIEAPAFVLIDEAQQLDPQLMSLLLTRIGDGDVKVIVAGDRNQKYSSGRCGLSDAVHRFTRETEDGRIGKYENIGYFEFDEDDIMRNPIVKTIIKAYRR